MKKLLLFVLLPGVFRPALHAQGCIAVRQTSGAGFDNILVLANGVVAEQGRHAELLARKGLYADLYHVQFGDTASTVSP